MTGIIPAPLDFERPYWESGRDGVLRLPRCAPDGHLFFPPGRRCPVCGSREIHWIPMSGKGKIWSFVVFHRQYFKNMPPPYTAVRVQLAEGPFIITNLVDAGDRKPEIGDDVRVVFEEAAEHGFLPQFTFA
jgi:uncharacterized OB-fold protein